MRCPVCGFENAEEASSCPVCGAAADPADSPSPQGTASGGMDPRKWIAIASVAIIAIAVAVVCLNLDHSEAEVTVGDTTVTGPLAANGDVEIRDGELVYIGAGIAEWRCKDLLSTYLVPDGAGGYVVRGHDTLYGSDLRLDPGYYNVELVVGGERVGSSTVRVDGKLTGSFAWNAAVGDAAKRVSISFSYDMSELMDEWNDDSPRRDSKYHDTTRFAKVGAGVKSLESVLKKAYLSAFRGGTQQDYADFILSFVQCCIGYPPQVVPSEGGRYLPNTDGYADTYLYGQKEYWAFPLQTLRVGEGDCEDTVFLACAIFSAAGYRSAIGMLENHAVSGVFLESFVDRGYIALEMVSKRVTADGTVAYMCETTYDVSVAAGYMSKSTAESVRELDRIYIVEAQA